MGSAVGGCDLVKVTYLFETTAYSHSAIGEVFQLDRKWCALRINNFDTNIILALGLNIEAILLADETERRQPRWFRLDFHQNRHLVQFLAIQEDINLVGS